MTYRIEQINASLIRPGSTNEIGRWRRSSLAKIRLQESSARPH
jgi:hypothetical protein